MTEKNPKGAGRKPKPPSEHKVRLQVVVAPDLAEWLKQAAGTKHGAVSRYVEGLIREARDRQQS
jgi:hypothetical protein